MIVTPAYNWYCLEQNIFICKSTQAFIFNDSAPQTAVTFKRDDVNGPRTGDLDQITCWVLTAVNDLSTPDEVSGYPTAINTP